MFQPSVPVFDGHAALGRQHDARVSEDTPDGLLRVMARTGIERALVYHRYAVEYDTSLGNRQILEAVAGDEALVPQFISNMSSDSLEDFSQGVRANRIRSIRICPKRHMYPFTAWVAGDWLEWMVSERIGLWVSMDEVEVRDLYDTLKDFPSLRVVLSGVHYAHFAGIWPLVRVLPNTFVELSRLDIMDGVTLFVNRIGHERLIFGSHFPDLDPEPYLFYIHRCRLEDTALQAICHDNLMTLLS